MQIRIQEAFLYADPCGSGSETLVLISYLIQQLPESDLFFRFLPLLQDEGCQLAAAFHPKFRLRWLEIFKPVLVNRVRAAMEAALELALLEEAAAAASPRGDPSPPSAQAEEDDFLASFTQPSNVGSSSMSRTSLSSRAQGLVATWLDAGSRSDLHSDACFLGEAALVKLFIKYNTAVPSSASVERFFSIGKDILRDKRATLSDENFNILMFLKGNQHLRQYSQ